MYQEESSTARRFVVMPPVIMGLLVLNSLLYLVQPLFGALLVGNFALWPLGTPDVAMTANGPADVPDFRVWQLVSYGFLHGNLLHLLTNMFAMWMFGIHIENLWGSRRFAVYFFICMIGAGLIQLVVSTLAAEDGSIYPTVGASGGVFGILLAFGMLFPEQRILLLFPPIPLKAKWFVILYGGFSLWAGITGTMSGVAHFAHLGGMLFGLMLLLFWRSRHTDLHQQTPRGR